jgi:predicted 3-demethylubiquinone-9 3-methyltransferase (glyoxalase superfamily)
MSRVNKVKGKTHMQKITPHLWFDKEAVEAAEFYTSVFPDSRIKDITTLHNTPSGSVDIVIIELLGQEFTLISERPELTQAEAFLQRP